MVIFYVCIKSIAATCFRIAEFFINTYWAVDTVIMNRPFMGAKVAAVVHGFVTTVEYAVDFYGCVVIALSFATRFIA